MVVNGEKLGDHVLRVDLQKNAKQAKDSYDPKRTVFVGNLKYSKFLLQQFLFLYCKYKRKKIVLLAVTDDTLHETFGCCGAIDYVRTLQSPKGCNGTAFVCFKDSASVVNALKLNNTQILGREARVDRYQTNKLGARAAKPEKNSKQGQRASTRENINKNLKGTIASGGGDKTAQKKQNFAGVKNNEKKVFFF